MDKIELENIVFCQGEDYTILCQDLDPDCDIEDVYAADFTESHLIEYLLQWWYPGEHSTSIYNSENINTEFLGYEINIDEGDFLLSHNTRIGYAGISRIVRRFNE